MTRTRLKRPKLELQCEILFIMFTSPTIVCEIPFCNLQQIRKIKDVFYTTQNLLIYIFYYIYFDTDKKFAICFHEN